MNQKLPWILVGVLGVICAFLSIGELGNLAGDAPRVLTKEVIREVPKEVIREVVREVPREVIKEVPAAIPEDYQIAKWFYESFGKSVLFTQKEALKGTGPIGVIVSISDSGSSLGVTEDELKNSIELALRRNGVPVKNSEASHALLFVVQGVWDDGKVTFSYDLALKIIETVPIFRIGGFRSLRLVIWEESFVGFAGKLKTREALTRNADRLVTKFSNEYLDANAK